MIENGRTDSETAAPSGHGESISKAPRIFRDLGGTR